MPAAKAAFRRALMARLTTELAPVAVHAHPPANAAMPYVTIDRILGESNDLLADHQTDVTITLTTWSKKRGPGEIEAIHATMHAALHDAALTLDAGAVAMVRWLRDDITRDQDGVTYVGSVLVQGLVEHAS